MSGSSFADRVRGVLRPSAATPSAPALPVGSGSGAISGEPDALERALGGAWRPLERGSCFVVEHRVPAHATYGRVRVGEVAARLEATAGEAPLLTRGVAPAPPFVFFDLETTGLSGGAGTFAFLIGCGMFEGDGTFVTRQYVMARYADERPMLEAVARELSAAGALVSFNGKSFDAPVIETRYLFHRLPWSGASLPHLDALHPARQFWGAPPVMRACQARSERGAEGAAPQADTSCSLIALEAQILGVRRRGDVPGFEIPARYFQFVRSGDARPLAAVLEHNRLDLLSLASLTCRLLHLVSTGPAEAGDPREVLALGRVYARSGLDARAREAFARAVQMTDGPSRLPASAAAVRVAALHALAVCERRARRYEEAETRWRALLEVPQCPPQVAREATEALAIHHEHRVRDLAAARTFALRSLCAGTGATRLEAARRRVARIDRKLERKVVLERSVGRALLDPPADAE